MGKKETTDTFHICKVHGVEISNVDENMVLQWTEIPGELFDTIPRTKAQAEKIVNKLELEPGTYAIIRASKPFIIQTETKTITKIIR